MPPKVNSKQGQIKGNSLTQEVQAYERFVKGRIYPSVFTLSHCCYRHEPSTVYTSMLLFLKYVCLLCIFTISDLGHESCTVHSSIWIICYKYCLSMLTINAGSQSQASHNRNKLMSSPMTQNYMSKHISVSWKFWECISRVYSQWFLGYRMGII